MFPPAACGRMVSGVVSGSAKEGLFREQGPLCENGINRNLVYWPILDAKDRNMQNRNRLCAEIDSVFSDVPRPNDKYISKRQDQDSKLVKSFIGKKSAEIDDFEDIDVYTIEELYSMSTKAIHYFLPCYLKYMVKQRESWLFVIVIGLIGFFDIPESLKCSVKYPSFTYEQIGCILKVLLFIRRNIKDYDLEVDEEEYSQKLDEVIEYWKIG